MTVFLYLLALTIGIYNLLDVLRTEFVLRLHLFKLLAGINEQDVIVFLAAFLHHKDAGRDACAIEDVGWKSDDGINIVLFLNKEATDDTLGIATEEHTVRSHCATLVQMVNHVQDKGVVGCLAWSETTCLAETIIVVELFSCTPFGRERRIGHYGIKLLL